MITVDTNYREQAKQKIIDGKKAVKGAHENAMKDEIALALRNFADQDNEFARAIVEGGTFAECMTAVAKGVGGSISDIDAIRRAVNFYFKGAMVQFSMTITVNPHDAEEETPTSNAVSEKKTESKSVLEMSLDDLF